MTAIDPPNRGRALTPDQIKAAALMATGASGAEIARAVGVRPETVSRWRRNPVFIGELQRLVLLASNGTPRERVEALMPRALDALQDVLTNTRPGALAVRVEAAKALLYFAAALTQAERQ